MVRFKVSKSQHTVRQTYANFQTFQNRWLLVEFLPVPEATPNTKSRPQEETTSKQIWAALKQSVISNFGDTGWGAVGSSLTSNLIFSLLPKGAIAHKSCVVISQIFLSSHEPLHHTRRTRPTQDRMGERHPHHDHRREEGHTACGPRLR